MKYKVLQHFTHPLTGVKCKEGEEVLISPKLASQLEKNLEAIAPPRAKRKSPEDKQT